MHISLSLIIIFISKHVALKGPNLKELHSPAILAKPLLTISKDSLITTKGTRFSLSIVFNKVSILTFGLLIVMQASLSINKTLLRRLILMIFLRLSRIVFVQPINL
jgi:hypothetical protein